MELANVSRGKLQALISTRMMLGHATQFLDFPNDEVSLPQASFIPTVTITWTVTKIALTADHYPHHLQ